MNQDPLCGRMLGAYQLIKKIGHGGMGMVYEVVHTQLQVTYAVKILHPVLTADELMVARLRREAAVALQLQHPNIVQVLDYGWDDELGFFLVMEFLRGRDLGELLQGKSILPISQIVSIANQVCRALSLAHQRGIIHRDLKPPNIFLCSDTQPQLVKLLDFGIARVIGKAHQTQLTRAGKSFGTPEYMPPEQIRASRDKIGPATDIYGLCVVIFRMLTGVLPFNSKNIIELMNQVMLKPPPMLSRFRPELGNTDLERLLFVCMAKNPANRIQPMDLFFERFNEAVENDPRLAPILAAEQKYLEASASNHSAHFSEEGPFALGDDESTQLLGVKEDDHGLTAGQSFVFGGEAYSFDGQQLQPSTAEQNEWPSGTTDEERDSLSTIQVSHESAAELASHILDQMGPSDLGADSVGGRLGPPAHQFPEFSYEAEDTIQAGSEMIQAAFHLGSVSDVLDRLSTIPGSGDLTTSPKMMHQISSDTTKGSVSYESMSHENPTQDSNEYVSLRTSLLRVLFGFLFGFFIIGVGLWIYNRSVQTKRECCELLILSTPAKARVIEQGQLLGLTPLRIKRSYGQAMQFVIMKKNYELITGSWKALRRDKKHFKLESQRRSLLGPSQK